MVALVTVLRVVDFLIFRVIAFWSQDNGTALGESPACCCIPGRKEKEQASILDVLSRDY